MTADDDKRAYVRAHKWSDPGEHSCHWPMCLEKVPASKWGCYRHWMRLPKHLRDKVWATFEPGQEITKTPSAAYVAVTAEIEKWIEDRYGQPN